jgi:hypothetical protein
MPGAVVSGDVTLSIDTPATVVTIATGAQTRIRIMRDAGFSREWLPKPGV